MTPEALLMRLRRAGVVLTVRGDAIAYDGPSDALDAAAVDLLRRHKTQIIALVSSAWWPPNQPRPNLTDLAIAHGAPAVRAAFHDAGCDLDQRNPLWEELFVAAEVLARRAR
jgi:hypothetical protein